MKYFFLGIGGIGMSALARYFKLMGHEVYGYDRTPSELTHTLTDEGMVIHYEDNPSLIPADIDRVVYTPAIPKDNKEYVYLSQSGIPMEKRAQALAHITEGKRCIAIAGSHGKTTTSAMVAHLLHHSGIGCTAFLGGIAKNYNSNLLIDLNSDYIVVEADEYDRSFLYLHPTYAVITATDPDHLDIYGTHSNMVEAFEQFANQTSADGLLLLKTGIGIENSTDIHDGNADEHHHSLHHLHINPALNAQTYSTTSLEADYYAINVRHHKGTIYFDMRTPSKVLYDVALENSCLYNVENAVAASAVALQCGISEAQLREGLRTFAGIKRRFDYQINKPEIVYIDDYAHHPREITATLQSIKQLYPGKRVVGVFQPHLYSRTADLYKEFAQALSPLDELVLMDIYPAREKPIHGVSSRLIMNEIPTMNRYICQREEVAKMVVALCPDVVVSMGAGDIDRLVPEIKKALEDKD